MSKHIFLSVAAFFLFFGVIYAHVSGGSTFTINGEHTIPPTADGSEHMGATEDRAPEQYAVGQTLNFEIDISKYHYPVSVFEQMNLIWDFGDGSPKQSVRYGIKNSHVYKDAGTYRLSVTADYASAPGFVGARPQVLQVVVIPVTKSSGSTVPDNPPEPPTSGPEGIAPNPEDTATGTSHTTGVGSMLAFSQKYGIFFIIGGIGVYLLYRMRSRKSYTVQ